VRTPTLPPPATGGSLFDEVVAAIGTVPPSLPPSPPPPSISPPKDRRLSQEAVNDVILEVKGGSPTKDGERMTTRAKFVAICGRSHTEEVGARIWAQMTEWSGTPGADQVASGLMAEWISAMREAEKESGQPWRLM
jgi:hypothetical protein